MGAVSWKLIIWEGWERGGLESVKNLQRKHIQPVASSHAAFPFGRFLTFPFLLSVFWEKESNAETYCAFLLCKPLCELLPFFPTMENKELNHTLRNVVTILEALVCTQCFPLANLPKIGFKRKAEFEEVRRAPQPHLFRKMMKSGCIYCPRVLLHIILRQPDFHVSSYDWCLVSCVKELAQDPNNHNKLHSTAVQ